MLVLGIAERAFWYDQRARTGGDDDDVFSAGTGSTERYRTSGRAARRRSSKPRIDAPISARERCGAKLALTPSSTSLGPSCMLNGQAANWMFGSAAAASVTARSTSALAREPTRRLRLWATSTSAT